MTEALSEEEQAREQAKVATIDWVMSSPKQRRYLELLGQGVDTAHVLTLLIRVVDFKSLTVNRFTIRDTLAVVSSLDEVRRDPFGETAIEYIQLMRRAGKTPIFVMVASATEPERLASVTSFEPVTVGQA